MVLRGTLEVLLVGAKGLDDADFFCNNMDPYAVLTYRTQEQRSSVASGKGSNPEWNETFVFTVSDNLTELNIKLIDKDAFSRDDLIGQAKIHLDSVFKRGRIPPSAYSVVKDLKYCGEIKVGLSFSPEDFSSRDIAKEHYGGWRK